MGTFSKGNIGKQDLHLWFSDNSARTFNRPTSQGYNITLNKLDWMGVDILQAFGNGVNQNSIAIAAALTAIAAVTDPIQLWLAPGTWSLTQSHIFGANVIVTVAPGAIIDTDMSIRSATYKWTLSGSGTAEYYLELAEGGDPGLSEPSKVVESAIILTAGAIGALAAGEWAWDDNDTLGYDTVYVRLSGSGDPDAQAAGYVLAAYNLTINGDLIAPNCKIMTGYGEINVERLGTEDVSTSGTGEDNLASSSVPAGFLGTTGGIRVSAAGTKTLSNGNKTIKFHWGSTAFTVHPPDNNIRDWQFDAEIWNTGYATQKIRWRFVDGDRDVMAHYAGYETATEDTSAAVTIKMTGECAHASDTITQTLWRRGRIT